ncbi:MAG: S-layer homology domain-containing protein, partial [Verrucomicrobia bacterium]|nr:S-layer homology domain-containing protein [Leptolyngbya sp. ES-bin-22]
MSEKIWKLVRVAPAFLSATVAISAVVGMNTAASAAESVAAMSPLPAGLETSTPLLLASPAIVADASAVSSQPVSTAPLSQVTVYGTEGTVPANGASQVTSVSQLSDVRPTDWAFQALQSLVERYGCIVGYPDKTYRGNRALTRYEFAAGLNACLDRVNELIAAG